MTKPTKTILSTVLLLIPLTAFAHGEQALYPFLIDIVNLIIFLFAILTIKFTLTGKLILTTIYILTIGLMTSLFLNYIKYNDYLENIELFNFIMFIIPLTLLYLSYLGLRTKFKKTD